MGKNRNLECADIFAPEYDQIVPANGWCTPEIISNLISDYVSNGDRLLDIGIGTGLSAIPFEKKGLVIYGVDGSAEMLKICDAKKIATKLDRCDLSREPLPYSDAFFNHVISAGVFHLLGDLCGLFSEVSRVLRKGGLFCFTVDEKIKVRWSPNFRQYAKVAPFPFSEGEQIWQSAEISQLTSRLKSPLRPCQEPTPWLSWLQSIRSTRT